MTLPMTDDSEEKYSKEEVQLRLQKALKKRRTVRTLRGNGWTVQVLHGPALDRDDDDVIPLEFTAIATSNSHAEIPAIPRFFQFSLLSSGSLKVVMTAPSLQDIIITCRESLGTTPENTS